MGSAALHPHLSFFWDPFSSKELGSKMEKDCKYQMSVFPCLSFFLSSTSIYLWGPLSSCQLNAESFPGYVCEFSRGDVGGSDVGGFPVHYILFWELSLTWSLLTPAQMLLKPDLFPPQILDPTASGGCSLFTLWPLFVDTKYLHQSDLPPYSSQPWESPSTLLPQQNLNLNLSHFSISLSLIYTHRVSLSFQLKYPQWALTSKSVHVSEKFLWTRHLLLVLGWGGQGCACVWLFPLSAMGRMSGLSLIPPQPTILNIVLAGSWTDGSG